MHPTKTCGQLFQELIEALPAKNIDAGRIDFKIGFLAGLAEKVYLGACPAACIRPATDELNLMCEVAKRIAAVYDLTMATFSVGEGYGIEVWLFRTPTGMADGIKRMSEVEINDMTWHSIRAELCGVDPYGVDLNFHERPGYDKRTT